MTTPKFISLLQTSPLYSEWYLMFYTSSLFGYLIIISNLIWLEPNCWSFPVLFFLWSSAHSLMAKPFLISHAKNLGAIFDSSLFLTANLSANICIISHQIISKISLLVPLLFSLFLNTVVRIVLLKCKSGHVAFLFKPTYSKGQKFSWWPYTVCHLPASLPFYFVCFLLYCLCCSHTGLLAILWTLFLPQDLCTFYAFYHPPRFLHDSHTTSFRSLLVHLHMQYLLTIKF